VQGPDFMAHPLYEGVQILFGVTLLWYRPSSAPSRTGCQRIILCVNQARDGRETTPHTGVVANKNLTQTVIQYSIYGRPEVEGTSVLLFSFC
jgi:hypothetical protein